MKSRTLLLILLVVILAWLQLAVEGSFNFLSGRINLVVATLVIIINLADWPMAIIFSVACGLLLDVYSGLPFGVLTVALFLTAVILEVLFVNFFTNFSFYSLLFLGVIASILYNILFLALVALVYFLGYFDFLPFGHYGEKFFWQVVTTILIMAAAYLIINRWSRRFKPMFLK